MNAPSAVAMVFGTAWAVLVGWAAFRRRPAPERLRVRRDLVGVGSPAAAKVPRVGTRVVIGGALLRLLRRPPDPVVACRLGGAVICAGCLGLLLPLAAVPAALVGWAMPGLAARRGALRRRGAVMANLAEVVDLLGLAVGAGLTVRLAVEAVGRRGRGPIAEALQRTAEEAGRGRRLADALEDLVDRLGEEVRPLVSVLVASERYGAPLAVTLERLALEARRQRRHRAEEAARRIPVKLLFPLVSCTLPAFALLTVAPLVASAVQSLRL